MATLDGHIVTLTRHRLDRAPDRIQRGQLPQLREFDLLNGLTGIGVYLLQAGHTELLRDVLSYLVCLTVEPVTVDDQKLPGWWTGNGLSGGPSIDWPGGHSNLGLAHGITGPAMLLASTLAGCLSDDSQLSQLGNVSVCHGWAGLVQTTRRAAADAGPDSALAALLPRLDTQFEQQLCIVGGRRPATGCWKARRGCASSLADTSVPRFTPRGSSPGGHRRGVPGKERLFVDLEDAGMIGARACMIRRRRGLSLEVVGGLAGITAQYLSMLERGLRGFNRRGLIEDLAEALGCSVADLTGQPYPPADRNAGDMQASLATIRLVLNDFGPMDVPDLTPRPSQELASLADRANEHCGQANYSLAGHDLGPLLAESQTSALTVAADERDRAFTAAVTACFVAGVVCSRAGYVDLAVTAAQRGYDLAQQHDNPALVGFARWYWACELTSTGARTRAHAVLSEGIDDLTPAVQLSDADTLPAELIGMMHLQQARAAARQKRADDAHAHLDEAARLAGRVGERNGMRQHFGPTNVAAWRASIGVELTEGAQVYDELTAAPIDIDALGSRERSSSMHFDFARALAQEEGPRDGEAIRHLDTADRIASQRIRSDPIARDLVLMLDRRARRRVWELDSLANRFGIRNEGRKHRT